MVNRNRCAEIEAILDGKSIAMCRHLGDALPALTMASPRGTARQILGITTALSTIALGRWATRRSLT